MFSKRARYSTDFGIRTCVLGDFPKNLNRQFIKRLFYSNMFYLTI